MTKGGVMPGWWVLAAICLSACASKQDASNHQLAPDAGPSNTETKDAGEEVSTSSFAAVCGGAEVLRPDDATQRHVLAATGAVLPSMRRGDDPLRRCEQHSLSSVAWYQLDLSEAP